MRSGTFAALQQEIERRLTPRYPQLWLNIGKSSQTALDVSGARSDKEKSDIMNTLEAIWQDDMAAGMSRREPLFDPERCSPSGHAIFPQLPRLRCRRRVPSPAGIMLSRSWI
jgi:DNA-damage-inducible protein I